MYLPVRSSGPKRTERVRLQIPVIYLYLIGSINYCADRFVRQ